MRLLHYSLGPRKADALLRGITQVGGYIESRSQVWKELGAMGNCVFRNVAPFLQIQPSMHGKLGPDCHDVFLDVQL
jgi:hypothetical protein